MSPDRPRAASLQEAIDRIAQEFDFPDRLTIAYERDDDGKTTRIEAVDAGTTRAFELVAPASEDESPTVSMLDEE